MKSINTKPTFGFAHLKEDLPAGLVVFLVALPLCLGIAMASGAPLFAGIISGIVGGIVVAFLSGSPLSVSGPAAGLTIIVLNGIQSVGSYPAFLLAVVIAGILQLILGFLKAGTIGYYFPSAVIKGMLAAIGIILIRKQLPVALGQNTDTGISYQVGSIIIAGLSMIILLIWEIKALKKIVFFKYIPAALVAVLLSVLASNYLTNAFPQWALSQNQLVSLPVNDSMGGFLSNLTLPDFSGLANYKVWVLAVTIAIIASLETLLSVEAADKLDPYKRITPTNRELKAQGLGNILSGLIGGLPMTAVIVRTSANINAGGKTKMSAIIHGVFLLASVLFFATYLNQIPLACLAAVLLVVGYKLTKISLIQSMYKLGWSQFLPFALTIIAIQASDLLKGIAFGMLVSVFYILRTNYKRDYEVHHEKLSKGGHYHVKLAEHVTFVNKGSIAKKLAEIPNNCIVKLDGTDSHYIDIDVLEIIHDFKTTCSVRNIEVELVNIPEFKGVAGH